MYYTDKDIRMNAVKRIQVITLILLGIFLLSGCASVKRAVLPEHRLIANIQTGKQLNRNERGRPSPLSVYFFQLKEQEGFEGAEFFDLYDKGKETLGDDYIAVSKVNLMPNVTSRLTLKLKPGVQYIGIVAAYRKMQGVVWRKVLPVDFSWGRKKVRLIFNQHGILVDSVLKTGSDIDLEGADFKKPDVDAYLNKKNGPDMNYQVIKKGN